MHASLAPCKLAQAKHWWRHHTGWLNDSCMFIKCLYHHSWWLQSWLSLTRRCTSGPWLRLPTIIQHFNSQKWGLFCIVCQSEAMSYSTRWAAPLFYSTDIAHCSYCSMATYMYCTTNTAFHLQLTSSGIADGDRPGDDKTESSSVSVSLSSSLSSYRLRLRTFDFLDDPLQNTIHSFAHPGSHKSRKSQTRNNKQLHCTNNFFSCTLKFK